MREVVMGQVLLPTPNRLDPVTRHYLLILGSFKYSLAMHSGKIRNGFGDSPLYLSHKVATMVRTMRSLLCCWQLLEPRKAGRSSFFTHHNYKH